MEEGKLNEQQAQEQVAQKKQVLLS